MKRTISLNFKTNQCSAVYGKNGATYEYRILRNLFLLGTCR